MKVTMSQLQTMTVLQSKKGFDNAQATIYIKEASLKRS